MSWSVTVNEIPHVKDLPLDTQEYFASQHPAYPRDAHAALALAKAAGLKSATLCGGRTPNPYTGDEIVDISVRGTPESTDFLSEMRGIIAHGPGEESDLARHYAALAKLRQSPCSHIFTVVDMSDDGKPWTRQCAVCGLNVRGSMVWFEGKEDGQGTGHIMHRPGSNNK